MSKHIPNRTQDRESARLQALVRKHERNEARLVRAQNAWQKSREQLKRYERKPLRVADLIPGEIDWRELAPRPGDADYGDLGR